MILKPTGRRHPAVKLFALLAIVLGVVLLAGVFIIEPPPNQGSPVETVENELHGEGIIVKEGCLRFVDPTTSRRQWQICCDNFQTDSLSSLALEDLAERELAAPRIVIFALDKDGGEIERARISAGSARIDPKSQIAYLDGRIQAVLDPDSPERISIWLDGPLELSLPADRAMELLSAKSTGAVEITSAEHQLSGVGLDLDAAEGRASFASAVRLLAHLEDGASFAIGGSEGVIVVTCRGRAWIQQYGGEDGLSPTLVFEEDVRVIANDGSTLTCERLEINGLPSTPRFVPNRIAARGKVVMQITGAGMIQGESATATRLKDGSWTTSVVAADGERIAGRLEVRSKDSPARELIFSAASSMSATRNTEDGIVLSFLEDIQGEFRLIGSEEPGATFTASDSLDVRLRDRKQAAEHASSGSAFGSAIESIVARGAIVIEDSAGSGGLLLADAGEARRYEAGKATATRMLDMRFDAESGLESVLLDGQATLAFDGVDLQSLQPRLSMGEKEEDESAGGDSPDGKQGATTPARTRVRIAAETLEFARGERDSQVLSARGGAFMQELAAKGAPTDEDVALRRLECADLDVVITQTKEGSVFAIDASAAAGKIVLFEDFTLKPRLRIEAVTVAIRDGSILELTGAPARALSGDDSIEGERLLFDTGARSAKALAGDLVMHIARGSVPVVAVGERIEQHKIDGQGRAVVWRLFGAAGKDARASGVDKSGSFELLAPVIQIDPKSEDAACPSGGRVEIQRFDASGARVDKINVAARGAIVYTRETGVITVGGGIHFASENASRPFEIFADSARATLAAASGAKKDGDTKAIAQVAEVVATGNVKLISGTTEATGHEARWLPPTGRATLARKGSELLRLIDRASGTTYEALDFWFVEGDSAGMGKSFGGTGLRVARK